MPYFIGIDIGNTKSHALIADENGCAVGFGQSGPGSYEAIGWDGLKETLQLITNQALASAGIVKKQIAGAGLGVAGYDWPAEREPTRQAIAWLDLKAPFKFVNDAAIGLLAGAVEGWGVVVSAGTSNNCYGRDRQGREGQITGCGPWAGEYGGANEIVAKAVQAVAMAWTRRAPATDLTRAFIELTGAVDVIDLLEGLALERYNLSAANAPTIFQVAAAGDVVAQEIVCWAGRELGSLAVGIIHQLDFEELSFEVVLAGSVYNSNAPSLIEAMQTTIHAAAPAARLTHLKAPPVAGAVLLGMEHAGLEYISLRQRLIKTTNALLRTGNW